MKILTLLFLVFITTALHAQSDTITANPKAVQLRRIWVKFGVAEQEYVGSGVGNCGDINGDSLGEFAVRFHGTWQLYWGTKGPLPDTPFFSVVSYGNVPDKMVIGDWFGTGHKALGFEMDTCHNQACWFRLGLYATDHGVVDSLPRTIVTTGEQCISQALSADLDEDGADELILTGGCEDYNPVLWVYHGGPSFDGSAPSYIINDPDTLRFEYVYTGIGDIDGDHHTDLVTVADYKGHDRMKIYWGDGTFESWSKPPEVIELPHAYQRAGWQFQVMDLDGDSIPDILLPGPDDGYLYLYRTRGTGKNARNRSFQVADADERYKINARTYNLGYLRGDSGRYAVLGLAPKDLYCLTSGAHGPNHTWDASYSYPDGGAFRYVTPLLDCDGDGWDDFAASNYDFGGFNRGIAAVYAGGPYIPTDDPTVEVRQEAITGRPRAISIWPNPVISQLNIAWRGDLPQMPAIFEIHNAVGMQIATGEVAIGIGSAIWNCAGFPSGSYFLSVYSKSLSLLTTIPFVKE